MTNKEIKILAIDDNPDNLVVLNVLLSEKFPGVKYITAQTGEKGVELCLSENPDVVLLDIVMPFMDGYEVCRKIRSIEAIKHIPVVMVTASRGDTDSRVRALESGADAFLAKPIDESELTAQVRAMVLIKESEERKRDEKERLRELVDNQTRELVEELKQRVQAEEELRREIIERKKTEEALRQSRKEFQNYFESGAVGMAVSSADKIWIEVNQKLCRMLGYSREELIGHSWIEITHHEDIALNLELFQQTSDGERDTYEMDKRFIRKDGIILYVTLSVVCQRNEDGTIHHLISSFVDITERKIAAEALKESEKRFRTLYENAPIGIYRTTADGQILLANPALVKLLGHKSSREFYQLDPNQKRDFELQYSWAWFKEVIERKGKVKGLETEIKRKNGSIIHIRESAVVVRDDSGNPLYYDGTIEDITEQKLAEGALKESRERYKALFDGSPDAILIADAETGMITTANKAASALLGRSIAELTKMHQSGIHPRKITDESITIFNDQVQKSSLKKSLPIEITVLRSDGVEVPVEIVANVTTVDGRQAIQGVFRDITWRKQAEKELKESEEKYRRMVDLSPDAVIIHASGKIVFANPATLYLMKAESLDQIMGVPAINFVHPDYKDIALERIKKIYQSGEPAGFAEEKFLTLDNEAVDVEVIGIPINYLGHPAVQTIARDITKRKKAEDALKESHEFNSSLLRTLPFGMQIVDETGTILFLDEKFTALFGNKMIGTKCWELYRDDKKQCSDCPLYHTIEIGKTSNYEARDVLGGKIFDISHTGMMYKGKKAMLEIFQDITQRKAEEAELIIAKEKAEESDRLKSAFLATMNHELRTPLNHILGFSSLIQSGIEAQESMEYASTIEASGKNLLSIIEDIFELSLVEQAKIKVRPQTFSLIDHFMENKSSLEEILRVAGKNEQIDLIFNPDSRLLSNYITADRSKINQVLANLFKNAIKFTHSGSIEFGYTIQGKDKLVFYVKDTGIGISKEKQRVIFDFFRQGDDSHTRLYGGIGIGLAISLKITHILNGELVVESEQGKGSKFSFIIPVEISDSGKSIKTDSPLKIDLDLKGKTILVVEDDPMSMMLVQRFLKATNVNVIEAYEGKEAIEKWRLHPEIDLVLMDLKMPGMDGFEATRRLKSQKYELPIIALTAYSLPSDKLKAIEAGCNSIVAKPLDKMLLFAEIKRMLN